MHFEVRSFESWGCYLQVDLSSVSPVFAVSQSPAFEFPIYTAGNAVAILLSKILSFAFAFAFFLAELLASRLSCFSSLCLYFGLDHAACFASAMLVLFRSGS